MKNINEHFRNAHIMNIEEVNDNIVNLIQGAQRKHYSKINDKKRKTISKYTISDNTKARNVTQKLINRDGNLPSSRHT